jgi:CheY-like chemotaxis protein
LSSDDEKVGNPPQQVFKGYRIAIVTETESIGKVLCKAFGNRGGSVKVYPTGKLALEAATILKTHVMVICDDVRYHNAAWCTKEIRYKKIVDVDVLWYVGRKAVDKMDGWIKKPFRPIELLKPIFNRLKSLDPTMKKKREVHSMGKILVVDDEEALRDLSELALRRDGYKVYTASHGHEGLRVVSEHPDLLCLLVDLNMPKMSGLEFIQRIRTLKAADNAAVVVVTAHANKKVIQEGASLRIDAWISKPFKTDKLLETVGRLITEKKMSQAG